MKRFNALNIFAHVKMWCKETEFFPWSRVFGPMYRGNGQQYSVSHRVSLVPMESGLALSFYISQYLSTLFESGQAN